MTHGQEFRAYMKAANHTSGNYEDRHLSETQMIALCRGEMSTAEREAGEAHLVGCEQCIALFRSARDFLEPARADEDEVTALETSHAWPSLWERVQTASASAGANVAQADFQPPQAQKPSFEWRATWWRPALAFAMLTVIAAGLIYLFSGKSANKPPESVHQESPTPAPNQPPTTAQGGTTPGPSPNPGKQSPPPAGEQVVAMNIKARPGTGFEDSATRGEREDAARASLLTERKIYLDVSASKRWRSLLSSRLAERLRVSGRFLVTRERAEAEVALKIVGEAGPRAPTDATDDQSVSFSARVVGADGKTLWPLTPGTVARRYQGQATKAADRLINDLLDDIQRLERKRP